jgi:hypothetical protein
VNFLLELVSEGNDFRDGSEKSLWVATEGAPFFQFGIDLGESYCLFEGKGVEAGL